MKAILPLLVMVTLVAACGNASTTSGSPTVQPASSDTAVAPVGATAAPPLTGTAAGESPTVTVVPAAGGSGNATAFPEPGAYRWAAVAAGLFEPTDIQFPDDGSGRMFVVEQPGRIRVVQNGQMLSPPFLDISGEVGSAGSEQGLLGLAFHPHFKDQPYLYVNYTDVNGNTVIARFQANGDQAEPASEKALMHIIQPFPNHNGGAMVFGPDGYLYIGLGDGGAEGDPLGYGQNTGVRLGKLLRIDVDHGDPYSIPQGNPFAQGGGRAEIWAYGLRNPWRASFDRATGDLYIADVGQDTWEEVDFLPAGSLGGANFGWSYREGMHPYSLARPPAGLQLIDPVVEYNHAEGGCAITGGYVYRGAMPEWGGIYLYGDYCSGMVWGLRHGAGIWQSKLLFQTQAHITTFGQDPSGEIYLADRSGTIYKLEK